MRAALEDVPHIQKRGRSVSVARGRPVITATQMLESMINLPCPLGQKSRTKHRGGSDGTSAACQETGDRDRPGLCCRHGWREQGCALTGSSIATIGAATCRRSISAPEALRPALPPDHCRHRYTPAAFGRRKGGRDHCLQ